MKLIVDRVIVGKMERAVIKHANGSSAPGYSMKYGDVEITVAEDDPPIAVNADALWFGEILVENLGDGTWAVGDPDMDREPEIVPSFGEACHRASMLSVRGDAGCLN